MGEVEIEIAKKYMIFLMDNTVWTINRIDYMRGGL